MIIYFSRHTVNYESKFPAGYGFSSIALGFILLWAFFDKLFGLGFATPLEKSWLAGASPTYGFLKFGATGMFGQYFQSLAGNNS